MMMTAVFVLAAIPAFGTTLAEYQKQISSAKAGVEELLVAVGNSEQGKGNVKYESDVIAEIRNELPATEKVEWPGGSVDTANGWLFAQLEQFQSETDSAKRGILLTAVSERLTAISKEVAELEKPPVAGRTKDEDKQKLGEILNRKEYQKAQVKEESLFQKWYREFREWLERVFPKPAGVPDVPTGVGSLQTIIQLVVFVVVLGLVGFLIYRFAPFFARRFGLRAKKEKKDRVILGERISADESAEDLFSEAEQLAREGNLRGAIRKGYIALLCELSDRKVIGLARHKTNRDYLRDVRKRKDLIENMSGLTTNFERNWYGLRPAEVQDWEDFRARYRQTVADV